MKSILICAQVYNAEKYLEQCIESVLGQTYPYFRFVLIDNGSTDRSREIINSYAVQDKRITPVYFEENLLEPRWIDVALESHVEEYMTKLDADDWWESNFLERMLEFQGKYDLDYAITGTSCYFEQTKDETILRKLDYPAIMTQRKFAQLYPYVWSFPSTTWGSVVKIDLFRKVDFAKVFHEVVNYGRDTALMLEYVKQCTRIGIDNSTLYHYRIHPSAISFFYNRARFDSNVALSGYIRKFLESHNAFDKERQEWLKQVHIASMNATLKLLYESNISISEKFTECIRIIEHPLTAHVLTADCDGRNDWYRLMQLFVAKFTGEATTADEEKQIRKILKFIAPSCANAFSLEYRNLYAAEYLLWTALLKDEWETAVSTVMDLIATGRYSDRFDLGGLLNSMIPDGFLLKDESDIQFYQSYAEGCRLILTNELESALDHITGILLENDALYAEERLLKLYLSIAALQNQIPAFLYGNIRLAYLCYNEGRYEECRGIVNDLEDMGAGEHEDLMVLKAALDSLQ